MLKHIKAGISCGWSSLGEMIEFVSFLSTVMFLTLLSIGLALLGIYSIIFGILYFASNY